MIEDRDSGGVVLFDDGDHRFIWLGADARGKKGVVQTMQYLIIDKGRGVLLDPGGVHLFPRVVAAASRYISIDRIDAIFFSHQDPDVSSGIALWLGVTAAKIYIAELWIRFIPHFGIVDQGRIVPIEGSGKSIRLGSGAELTFVPTHYMHSPAAFSLFDARAGVLFSGDVGGAVFPDGEETAYVDDFKAHLKYIEGFHKRLVASNSVAKRWAENARRLGPKMIAPQHGAVYRGDSVGAFLDWLSALRCGVDELDALYRM
ncbi:MAG: MBL fold metallo-hydrolase [Spirochaetes bacterium]|nr:MBL fold metallo-hydrolase [Spirochaetota bacterium]MBU1079344.1 MBL fold metallo-hydrolase [Spirochaetota bacterium]